MKIKKVEIEAFRAYKSKLDGTFDFTNDDEEPANFVAIYAPNGFGKSSFYDAVEWAVTNRLNRLVSYKNELKTTKNKDEGLNIVRNKYADDKVETTVLVSTNGENNFKRRLPKIRKNQNDMSLGDPENDYFRHTILSQDEIEKFLREEQPQERYAKFIKNFGGDLETARKELTALINDNKSELNNLEKKCQSLRQELKDPIDSSIFDHFNFVALRLNLSGENIWMPNGSITSEEVRKLDASLLSRQHELNTSLDVNNKLIEDLESYLSKVPEIKLYTDNKEDQRNRLKWLSKGITDSDQYRNFLNSHDKYVESQKQANIRISYLNGLAENVDYFLQIESRIKELNKHKNDLIEDTSKLNYELTGFHKNYEEINKELKAGDEKNTQLKQSLANSDAVYKELSTNRDQRDILTNKIANVTNEIQIEKSRQKKFSDDLLELSKLKLTTSSLLAGDLGNLNFEQEKIERFAELNTQLDLLVVYDKTLQATQKALSEQMGLHEQLISMGLDYLDIESSNICPLCTTPHPSSGKLVESIKSQSLESNLTRDTSIKIAESLSRQAELRGEIQRITQEALEAQSNQLSMLRENLNLVKESIIKSEKVKAVFESELKILDDRSTELVNSVWGLSKQELLNKVEFEINQLSQRRQSLVEKQNDCVASIQQTTELVKLNTVKSSQLDFEISSKSKDSTYLSLLEYLNENSIAVKDAKSHFKEKIDELELTVSEYAELSRSMVNQCHELQQEMISNGTWVDVNQLKNEKEDLEKNYAKSLAAVNSFYESISNVISASSDQSLEELHSLLKIKRNESQVLAKELEELLVDIKLLIELIASFNPYLKHISDQKELELLKEQIKQREDIDEMLVKEKTDIIKKLKLIINGFFFEDLINSIYKKIDPHPTFKNVEFKVSFETDKPSLDILVSDDAGGMISPVLYFSAAQTNILSLSVFLANALHAKNDKGDSIDVILVDDPIQAMDSINVLSTIDLLRSICLRFGKQLIISTHDENFFRLLQRKIPSEVFGSKFLQLKKFGVVEPV